MDDNTESSEEEDALPPPLIDDFDVLANFPNLQNIPQFQEEVQYEDLLGFVQPAEAQPDQAPLADASNNMQIGMVHTFFSNVDPTLGGLYPANDSLQTSFTTPNPILGGPSSAPSSPNPVEILGPKHDFYRVWATRC